MKKLVLLTLLFSQFAYSITLDDYLAAVKKRNRVFTATDYSYQAADDRRAAGDIVLAPTMTASYGVTDDKSLPSTVADERKLTQYSLGVSKKFSTGTSVSLNGQVGHGENSGLYGLNGLPATTAAGNEASTGTLGVAIQQSIWRDFFGAATRLRHEREEAVNLYEKLTVELRRRDILVEAESSFWDFAISKDDLKLKQENVERARKLDRWTSGRVNNGISDRADLMNVRALSALRDLELQDSLDQLKTQEIRFRQNLDLADNEPTPEVQANLAEKRPYMTSLMSQKNVILIQSYLTSVDAKKRRLTAEELLDTQRPDLALVGSYNTNSYDPAGNRAVDDITKTDRPRTYVGVALTWLIDTDAKRGQISAAQKDALAAKYTAEKSLSDGRTAWSEQLRKYQVALESVKTLEKIASLQKERVKAEQDKFAKGRTITTNVVTAETDSATADVNYLRAQSGLKKLEANTLYFTSVQE